MAWVRAPSAITDSTSRSRSVESSNALRARRRRRHHREPAADDLAADEGDVDVLLKLPDELAAFLGDVLDPHDERSAPPGLYWPGSEDESRRRFGLSGPDSRPTCR